ncbi:MAG: MBL fold metallo-hydrolase, partial [Rhodospirillales bacterium]|nr:MBL fold metallo-hydrolase [Rhodospirillales bacterium]
MAVRFLDKKTQRFYFVDPNSAKRRSYVLIFGDEVETMTGAAPSGTGFRRIKYRGREGEMKTPPLAADRSLEMYFLDVGQGDAAFIVTPNNTKILVDGGLKDRALGFLIWKYRLDRPNTAVEIDHLVLSHADQDHVEGLIPLLKHPKITVRRIWHNGIGVFDSGFDEALGDVSNDVLTTLHDSTADLQGLALDGGFAEWIQAVDGSGAQYRALDASA